MNIIFSSYENFKSLWHIVKQRVKSEITYLSGCCWYCGMSRRSSGTCWSIGRRCTLPWRRRRHKRREYCLSTRCQEFGSLTRTGRQTLHWPGTLSQRVLQDSFLMFSTWLETTEIGLFFDYNWVFEGPFIGCF